MKNYVGIIQKEKKYGIVFPDFPGCVSFGDTIEEVYKNGIEALSLHINGMMEDNDLIPEPRTIEEIKKTSEEWYDFEDAIFLYIPYIQEQNKVVRINISINQGLLNKIDTITKNRSAFLSEIAEKYIWGYKNKLKRA
jgi:predicted RNase H-like HicB family nuclease